MSRQPRYLFSSVLIPNPAPTVPKVPYLSFRSAIGRKPPVTTEICGERSDSPATSRVVWAIERDERSRMKTTTDANCLEFMIAKVGSVSSLSMERIQMVDLKGLTARIRPELDEAISRVVDSGIFIGGEEVYEFSNELADELNDGNLDDEMFVVPCANGTDALQIALMALGVGAGDEVITPTFTFISTVEVIALLGAKPVLVDVNPDTFNIDCAAVEAAITDLTKAIIPVHLFGQCADMGRLIEISDKHNIHLVEDTAQSLMSIYCDENGVSGKAGTFGVCGTTSFFPSKNLGCMGDGGAIFTRSGDLAKLLRSIATHGSLNKYSHEEIGVNSRLDAMQAAILRVKLKQLKQYNRARLEAANRYDELLKDVEWVDIPFRDPRSSHVFNQYTIKLNSKSCSTNNEIQKLLKADGIPTGIYYPTPIHLQPAYICYGYAKGDFPVSEKLSQMVLSLPMHTELCEEQQEHIIKRLIAAIEKCNQWT